MSCNVTEVRIIYQIICNFANRYIKVDKVMKGLGINAKTSMCLLLAEQN